MIWKIQTQESLHQFSKKQKGSRIASLWCLFEEVMNNIMIHDLAISNMLTHSSNNYWIQSSTVTWIDWLMGADEAIHTICFFWICAVASDKITWCVSLRQRRFVYDQAVSSVAPLVSQFRIAELCSSNNNNRAYCARLLAVPKLRSIIRNSNDGTSQPSKSDKTIIATHQNLSNDRFKSTRPTLLV